MTKLQQVPGNDEDLNSGDTYRLRLFVTGASPNSTRAILNLKNIKFKKYLRYTFERKI